MREFYIAPCPFCGIRMSFIPGSHLAMQWCDFCNDLVSYYPNSQTWNYKGIVYNHEEFSRLLKLKAFC